MGHIYDDVSIFSIMRVKNKMKNLTLLAVLICMILGGVTLAQDAPPNPQDLYEGQVAPPEFPADLDWINTENPLTMQGLIGKIVIFDFWTYGCINCIHMIPVLAQIEEKYAEEVMVIGVHSAKFDNEGQTNNLRQIVQRYNLHHPVINDNQFVVWQAYGAQAWPTIAIVDPRGNLVARDAGETPFEALDRYLSGMIEYYDGLDPDIIDRTPLDIVLEGAGDPGTPLLFPGKVLADEASDRLFIADSNHNRIVIVDLSTNEVIDIIGSARRGFDDGIFDDATFNQLQGMALDGDLLYIADVNNHAIRVANLSERTVSTIAGTGEMGRGGVRFGTVIQNPLEDPIRSPWDVELDDDGFLHIAMAGTHQLYIYEPELNILYPSVGNGREANLNDVSLADSELAQPSGLYYAGDGKLYFADSESSTIRLADFDNNLVTVVAGTTDNNLFAFGDVDGDLGDNRLQHALGVQGVPNGDLYIADTYNSRIKVVHAGETSTETAYGLGGLGGYVDGDADVIEFDEPGGLSYANGVLYIADTNNHVIRMANLDTETVDTLIFSNPEDLVIDPDTVTILGSNTSDNTSIMLDTQSMLTGEGKVTLTINLPDEFKINDLIESHLELLSDSDAIQVNPSSDENITRFTIDEPFISIPITFSTGEGTLNAELTLYYCREGEEALCFIDTVDYIIPVIVGDENREISIALERDVLAPTDF
jgi:thiol-disulfide isomerase/thioredoxin